MWAPQKVSCCFGTASTMVYQGLPGFTIYHNSYMVYIKSLFTGGGDVKIPERYRPHPMADQYDFIYGENFPTKITEMH